MIVSSKFIGEDMGRFFLLFLGFMMGIHAFSGELSDLTLEDAIKKVKKSNPEITIAKFDEEIKRLDSQIAQGAHYGSLDLKQLALRSNDAGNVFGFKLQNREVSSADFQPIDLNYPKARNNFQTQVEYTFPLYTGGKLEQYGRITKALQSLSTLEREQLTHQKIYEVKKSFYAISLLDSFIYNLKRVQSNIHKLEQTAQEMIKEGYAKKVDVLEIEVKASDIARLIYQAEANRALTYHFLSFLLDEKVVSVRSVDEDALHVRKKPEVILENNLDIQKAQKGVEISKMNIALQESAFLPTIGAFAQYGSSDDKPFDDFAKHDSYTVGMQIKWNLFNGGIDKNNVEKARVENLKMAEQLSLAQKNIALHVETIQTQMKAQDYEIQSLKKEVELARAIYENYLGRYSEKLVSINDVMMKQSEEIAKVLKLKEVQNSRNEKIFELAKIANGEAQ